MKDYYVAAIKGAILSQLPDARIVDISHEIKPFDTTHAAMVIRNCFFEFPKGSVHLIGVNPDGSEDEPHLIVEYEGHFFVGADNGVFSLIFDKKPDAVVKLDLPWESDNLTFPMRNLFVKAACHLIRGGTPEVIGKRTEGIRQAQRMHPLIDQSVIRAHVVHIDAYGNIISNCTRDLFKEVGKGREFIIQLPKVHYDIRKIHTHYNQVPAGEKVASFNSAGNLEIAINKGAPQNGGGASNLLGVRVGDIIRIEFYASQNR